MQTIQYTQEQRAALARVVEILLEAQTRMEHEKAAEVKASHGTPSATNITTPTHMHGCCDYTRNGKP